MPLLTLAFPKIQPTFLHWIQAYRKANDKQYHIIEPHFTIVFPTNELPEKEFIDEITTLTKGTKKIAFEITKAIVHKDVLSSYYHEFLIPQKGNTAIIQLHDKLYSQKLVPALRTDIGYIPHITIGNSKSFPESNNRVEALNVPTITGSINSLSIASYENGRVSTIADIELL